MIGNNEAIDNLVRKTKGISRGSLNTRCFLGLVSFGILLPLTFQQLGKKGKGSLYYFPFILFLALSGLKLELIIIAAIIYIVGWIDANRVLSNYQALTKQRIAEIDQIPTNQQTTDFLLERGLLNVKVLGQIGSGIRDFVKVLKLPGGDPQLLNLAGLELFNVNRVADAKEFFDRALENVKDEGLLRQLKKNQARTINRLPWKPEVTNE
jgi:hypothetical protein